MSLYLFLRLLHITSAILFVGGLFARQAVRSLMSGASDLPALTALNQAAGRVERLMVIPGNLLAIVSGVLLALLTRSPILGAALGPYRNWLLVSILILVLLLPLVPLVFLPRGRLFEGALREAAASGDITPELRRQLDDPLVRWAHLAEMAGVALIVLLMVLKPI